MSESRTQRSTRPGIGYRQPALRAELIEFCTAAIVPTSLAVAAESAPRRSTNLQVARLSRMDVPASSSPNVDTSNPQQPTETSRNSCEAGAPRLRRSADRLVETTTRTRRAPCLAPVRKTGDGQTICSRPENFPHPSPLFSDVRAESLSDKQSYQVHPCGMRIAQLGDRKGCEGQAEEVFDV
jgi:hypothetical protein